MLLKCFAGGGQRVPVALLPWIGIPVWRVNLDERRATIWMRTVSRRLDDARALIVAGVI